MPGPIHDGLLALLTQFPALAFELATRCGAHLHGDHLELRAGDPVFHDPGTTGRLFTADAVLVGVAIVDDESVVVDGLALEIQTWHDQFKLISWVVYRAGVRSRHRCRAWTMVVSPDEGVRRRARELFEHEPELCPLIVEPKMIPPVVDVSEARRRPEVAILSAVMHAGSELGVACARAAFAALEELPPEFRQCYLNLINACLQEEHELDTPQPLPSPIQRLPDEIERHLSKMERSSVWYALELRELQALERARQEHCATLLATLWDTLDQRNVHLDPDSRARLEQCGNVGTLSRILVRAATATSAADLSLPPP